MKTEAGARPPNPAPWNGGAFADPFRESQHPGGGGWGAVDGEIGGSGGGERQASPAPRLNDQSATSASTELLEGHPLPCQKFGDLQSEVGRV